MVTVLCIFEKHKYYLTMARWPSWLWRQVKVILTCILVRETERGFKSHSCHIFFAHFFCQRILVPQLF